MGGPPAAVDERVSDPFRFEYDPPALRSGRGVAADLAEELAAHGLGRALVVCGRTVGSTPAVIDHVREGLGGRLAGVFAETTPEKRLSTAAEGLAALDEHGADAIVALGGGSSLDVATVISVLAGRVRAAEDGAGDGAGTREEVLRAVGREFEETGTVAVPEAGLVPLVAVPTTLAGADVSQAAGLTATPEGGLVEEPTDGGVSDPGLAPAAVVVDSALLETTPERTLSASAMNGFDKGIETLYARTATPVTDATATRGLTLFREGLLAFGAGSREPWVFDALARGTVLVQYGVSRPGTSTLSLIHAFGHGLTRTHAVQQGAAHGVIAPHALAYLFDQIDGRRRVLAGALDASDTDGSATAVVEAVTEVRDTLGLPARLRDVDGPEPGEFPAVAETVLADPLMDNVPEGVDATASDIEGVLESAW